MPAFTLEEAKQRLMMWLEAENAVATGQSYQIGTRRLERANLYQIREQIKYWEKKVNELEGIAKRGSTRRAFRAVPRDL